MIKHSSRSRWPPSALISYVPFCLISKSGYPFGDWVHEQSHLRVQLWQERLSGQKNPCYGLCSQCFFSRQNHQLFRRFSAFVLLFRGQTRPIRMGRETPQLCRLLSKRTSGILFPLKVLWKLVDNGQVLNAYKVIMVAADKLPKMDVFDYSFLVHSLCKDGYNGEALDVCVLARSKGVELNIVTYNSVINGLCLQGCLIEAFRLFDSLERIGLVPSVITYGTLIDHLSKRGFLLDARELFDKMVCKGCSPNARIYNSLVDNYCKNSLIDEALRLLADMEINDVKPDEFTVSVIICGYCQKGDMEGALDFVFEFKNKGVSPDFLGFTHLIRGLYSKGRMEEARGILREMLSVEHTMELINSIQTGNESESVGDFLVSLCEQGNIKEAIFFLNRIGSVIFPVRSLPVSVSGSQAPSEYVENEAPQDVASGLTESHLSDCHIEVRHMKDIAKLVETYNSAEKNFKVGDFGSYYSLISSLCSKGDVLKANEFVDDLLSNL